MNNAIKVFNILTESHGRAHRVRARRSDRTNSRAPPAKRIVCSMVRFFARGPVFYIFMISFTHGHTVQHLVPDFSLQCCTNHNCCNIARIFFINISSHV